MITDGINEKKTEISAYLMVGQSNMAGRGDAADVEPIENDRCRVLRFGRWQSMREPINPDRGVFSGSPKSGISLGASFADEMTKVTEGLVGLIPAADGGTSINLWQPGEPCLEYAKMITSYAMKTSRIAGIIWHQGESNSRPFGAVDMEEEVYTKRLITTLDALREQIGECAPVVIGELPRAIFDDEVGPRRMNGILHRIAEAYPNCRIASSEGLTVKKDKLHFDAVSLRELGKRYAEEMKQLLK